VRTKQEIEDIYDRRVDMVFRVCRGYMRSPEDAEDACQDTFIQLINKAPSFNDDEHEKAWLIRVASNICKNKLKHPSYKSENIEDHENIAAPETRFDSTLEAVWNLPVKYKSIVYMHYYEGYTSVEIAKLMKKPESTIRNQLLEARNILKSRLGD